MNAKVTERGPVLIVSGSLRRPSLCAAAASIVSESLSAAGIPNRHIMVGELGLPMYDPNIHVPGYDLENSWIAQVRECGAMVWVVPGYHRNMSGVFKNALDFLEITAKDDPPYLRRKFVGLIASSIGYPAALHTITGMIHAAHALRAFVTPTQVFMAEAPRAFDETTRLITDARIQRRLSNFCKEFAHFYRAYQPEID